MKIPWRQGRESATIAENIEHFLYQEMFRHVLKLNVFMKTNARIPRKWQCFPNRSGVGKMSFTYISRIFASNNYWYSLEQLRLCSWISQQQFCVMKLLKIVFDVLLLDQLWKVYYSRIIILIYLFVSHRVSNRAHATVLDCCQAPPVSHSRVIHASSLKKATDPLESSSS